MAMTPGMKMLMVAKAGQGGRMERGSGGRMESGGGQMYGGYNRMEGGRMDGGYSQMTEQPEMRRRRDERGRYMEGGNTPGMRYDDRHPDMDRYPQDQRRIGFEQGGEDRQRMEYMRADDMPEMRRRRDKRGRYMTGGDNVSYFPQRDARQMHYGDGDKGQKVEAGGTFWMIPPSDGHEKLTRDKAEKWVKSMHGSDPKVRGEMWSYDDAKALAEERGISTEGQEMVDFYSVLNMVYNDYAKVAKDHGVDTEDYYADLACAWLYDPDGKPPTEKLMSFKRYVVPHGEE